MELFAASLRADKAVLTTFLDALAIKLDGSLPEYTKITRQGSIFSREHPVKEIKVSLGKFQYRIGREKQGQLVFEFFAVGTSIMPIAPDHHIPPPSLTLSLNS